MKFVHKKTGNIYETLFDNKDILNCTNNQDGQHMILYKREGVDKLFVREMSEFYEKFEPYVTEMAKLYHVKSANGEVFCITVDKSYAYRFYNRFKTKYKLFIEECKIKG